MPTSFPACSLFFANVSNLTQSLSDFIGLDVSVLKFSISLALCFPLGMLMNILPYGRLRHWFSFLAGALLLQYNFGLHAIHQLITSMCVYLLLRLLPYKTATLAVLIFAMLYLSVVHLSRQWLMDADTKSKTSQIDFTCAQVILTQKLFMLAFNLHDGQVLLAQKDSSPYASKKCSPFALHEPPNLLEYLGYTYCFSNILMGPAVEFSIYQNACSGLLLHTSDGRPRGKTPSVVWPTIRPLLSSWMAIAVVLSLEKHFGIYHAGDNSSSERLSCELLPIVLRPDILSKPWLVRIAYAYMMIYLSFILKLCFVWKVAEAASNTWYLGFEGYDDEGQAIGWNNACNLWRLETASDIQTATKAWNKKTSLWMQRYVYMRCNGSLLAVYTFAAIWHGFYPGFYLAFLSMPLYTLCSRLCRKKISPLFPPSWHWSGRLYNIVCIVATSLCVKYTVASFILLRLDYSLSFWKSHYFFGHATAIFLLVVVSQLPTPHKKKMD